MSRQPWFASADAMLPRVRDHQPTMLPGNVLVDYLPSEGLYRSWEGAPDRSGHALTFPCASGSSGPLDATDDAMGHQLNGVADRVSIRKVIPGPLDFADQSFDVVFSKDSIRSV